MPEDKNRELVPRSQLGIQLLPHDIFQQKTKSAYAKQVSPILNSAEICNACSSREKVSLYLLEDTEPPGEEGAESLGEESTEPPREGVLRPKQRQ